MLTNDPNQKSRHEPTILAYSLRPSRMQIQPANVKREWMEATYLGFANRCLPLRIANESGWFLLNDQSIEVVWNGGPEITDLSIEYFGSRDLIAGTEPTVESHFGSGVLTWRIPYLFRTPQGYDLYVRGPANWCKDGACPLDAIVETDWAVATFTMNWKITRIGVPIQFEESEPICMIFPQRRREIEGFSAELRSIDSDPELQGKHTAWMESRKDFLDRQKEPNARPSVWQKHYYAGKSPSGDIGTAHRVEVAVRKFDDLRLKRTP